jgi:hypothetical protein
VEQHLARRVKGRRPDADVRDLEVAAGVGEFLAAPGVQHDVERLVEDGARLADRDAEDAVLRELVAAPHTHLDAAPAHVVEERHALGEAEGMGEGQVHDRRPDANPARARGQVPGEEEGVARETVRGEVLLGHPHVVEAERLRQLRACQLLGDGARGLLPRGALEDVVGAEAHGARA